MKALVVSSAAKSDLTAIRRYSIRRWGVERAESYVGLILQRFAWLMLNSPRGALQAFGAPGLRRINVRRHAVFYVDGPERVEIARILHQQMNHAQQFAATPEDDA